jgi:hypothetical protein
MTQEEFDAAYLLAIQKGSEAEWQQLGVMQNTFGERVKERAAAERLAVAQETLVATMAGAAKQSRREELLTLVGQVIGRSDTPTTLVNFASAVLVAVNKITPA